MIAKLFGVKRPFKITMSYARDKEIFIQEPSYLVNLNHVSQEKIYRLRLHKYKDQNVFVSSIEKLKRLNDYDSLQNAMSIVSVRMIG